MWFRVHDGFHSSRKLHNIPKRQKFGAVGLWTIAGSWAMDEKTDGHIPDSMIALWGPPPSAAESLVNAGLWERTRDGFDFRNWIEYQASREDMDSEKEANRLRKAESRHRLKQKKLRDHAENMGMSHVTGHDVTDPGHGGVTTPIPFHTIPIVKDSSSEPTARPDAEELCTLLADLVEANGSKRPTITKAWRTEARRMLDIDGRELDKTRNLIRWSQADGFWRKNILSMPKFRQRYDQLRLAALEDWDKNGGSKSASPDGQIDVDAVLGRDVWSAPSAPPELWDDPEAERDWLRERREERRAERLEEAKRVLARRQGVTV